MRALLQRACVGGVGPVALHSRAVVLVSRCGPDLGPKAGRNPPKWSSESAALWGGCALGFERQAQAASTYHSGHLSLWLPITLATYHSGRPNHHSLLPPPQDEEFLYLVMEYLPGGDVMVRHR